MLGSISGQNERWAQIGAHQTPPTSRFGQGGSTAPPIVPAGPAGTASPAASAKMPLSDSMSFALMALNTGAGDKSKATGQTISAAGVDPLTDRPPVSETASIGRNVGGLASAPPGDYGPPGRAQAGNDASGGALRANGQGDNRPPSAAQDTSESAMLTQLQSTLSGTGGTTGSGSTAGLNLAALTSRPPIRGNDGPNRMKDGDAGGDTTGSARRYSDGLRQQVAASAYSSYASSGLDTASASALSSIKV